MSIRETSESEEQPREEAQSENAAVVRLATPYYTYTLMACIIVVAVFQHATGLERSLDMAGFVKPLFLNGEYWRILTGSVLHVSAVHIALNAYALYIYGKLVEQLSSHAHVALIFLLAAIGGDILSLIILPDGSSAGASGGIVGMLGYLLVYGFRRRQFLSPDFIRSMLINTALLVVFGLGLYQTIDNYGHLGGFITGAVYALVQVPGDPYKDPRKTGTVLEVLGLIALGILIATSVFSILLMTGVTS